MSAVTETRPAKKWAMPDTLVIIFFVAILTSLATWVVPVGMFDSQEVQYQVDGQTKTRKVVDPHSFRILTNEAGEEQYHPVKFFTTGDESPGLMNFPFEGLTSGSGQAALTMPLLAPLGDLVGVNRQVTVLAFQFGDGFSHIIYPTSASLMATLGVCRVDFRNWLKVGATLLGLLFIMSSVVVIGAQIMGYH